MRALIVSAPTLDRVLLNGQEQLQAGGPALYAGLALRHLGYEVYAVGPYGPLTLKTVKKESELRITRLCCDNMGDGLLMVHVYDGGVRKSRREGHVTRLSWDVVRGYLYEVKPDLVIVSPNYDEIDLAVPGMIRGEGFKVALDFQGFARFLGDEWWRQVPEGVADLGHISDDDAPASVTTYLAPKVGFLLYTVGINGAVVYARGRVTALPSRGGPLPDRTGAGDVMLALVAHRYLVEGLEPEDAYERSLDDFLKVMASAPVVRRIS